MLLTTRMLCSLLFFLFLNVPLHVLGDGNGPPVITDGVGERNSHSNSGPSYDTANLQNDTDSHNGSKHSDGHGGHEGKIHIATVAYSEVRDPLIFTIVVLLAALSKIVYHHADILSSKVPESCILIILGTVFGAVIHFSGISESLPQFFQPHEFFIFLLPPIILEASFSLHDRTFTENIGSILLFAVVGTCLACALLGGTLYGLAKAGAMGDIADMSFMEIMVFSSLIVAVDPVAVLAVFNEIGVNHVLYFLVFGESLLNDGVTVVLYKVFQAYNVMEEITGLHIFLGIVKFLVVCLGGLAVGILAGLATALLTKYATHVKVSQPIIIFTMAYFGFLMSELFEFSGIISIIGCGLTQMQYAFNNISDKSRTTIKYFTKVISSANEIIIFLFLGLSMVTDHHDWNTGFTLWTIFFCLVYRFIIICGMSFLINWLDIYRVRKIGLQEQFMIAYGGLRGAVCFSLVAMLDPQQLPTKNMFVTTTLAVIVFTVFVQGITIKPLVNLLQIKLAPEKNRTMYKELNSHVTDHVMAGIEDIIGDHGRNHLREKLEFFDAKYFKPVLQVEPDPRDSNLKIFYENLLLKEHYNYLKLSGAATPEIPELAFLNSSGETSANASERSSLTGSEGAIENAVHILGPHINTELLLSSLAGAVHPAIVPGLTHIGEDIAGRGSVAQRSASIAPTITVEGEQEPDVVLRQPGRIKRAMSSAGSGEMNATALRSLLLSQRNTRMVLSKYDRNLTSAEDIHSQLQKRTTRNRQLQRLFSHEGTPVARRRVSWSDADAQVCSERSNHKAPPRHAMTVDLGNAGRMGVVEPVSGAGDLSFSPLPTSPHTPLDSVFEEDEVEETQPMLNKEGQKITRGGQKSSKHKLERQMGLEVNSPVTPPTQLYRQEEVERQSVPLKNLEKSGASGESTQSADKKDKERDEKGDKKDDTSSL